jgi:TPR repeat protein
VKFDRLLMIIIKKIHQSISEDSIFHKEGAFKLYLKSAKKGYKEGNLRVSRSFRIGFGCQSDQKLARFHIERSVNKGQVDGLFFKGIYALNDNRDQNAFTIFEELSKKNYITAHICSGFFQYYPIFSKEQNIEEAHRLLLLAGEYGDSYCAKIFSKCFKKCGFGFPVNSNQRNRFLSLASEREPFDSSLFRPFDFIFGYTDVSI